MSGGFFYGEVHQIFLARKVCVSVIAHAPRSSCFSPKVVGKMAPTTKTSNKDSGEVLTSNIGVWWICDGDVHQIILARKVGVSVIAHAPMFSCFRPKVVGKMAPTTKNI